LIVIGLFFVTAMFLTAVFALTALSCSLCEMPRKESGKWLQEVGRGFWYAHLHQYFFGGFKALFFSVVCGALLYRYLYGISAFLLVTIFFPELGSGIFYDTMEIILPLLLSICLLVCGIYVGDVLPRVFSAMGAELTAKICAPVAAPFLLLAFPFTALFLKLFPHFSDAIYAEHFEEQDTPADEILEIMERAEVSTEMSRHEKQLIESVFNFRKRIVREVMVPRIETFALPVEMSISEAAKLLEQEGYSRTPVYRNSIDDIVGVLMYKDILKKYMEYTDKGNDSAILNAPIETIMKPALYTPEMKKISNLLQEFRNQQVHLAIIIDEYGGTEGIVTIEDILEEIVGDIADEYDREEELFEKQSDHAWIVDARLNIFDAEEQFNIKIPQEGEYDTLGGYIYHRAGTIPAQGFVIHHDDFEMEVVASSERAVEKVRIKKHEDEQEL